VASKESNGMTSTGSRNKEEQEKEKEKHGEEPRSVSVSFSRSRALSLSLARSLSLDVDDKKMERFFSSIPSNNIKLGEDREHSYCRWIIESEKETRRERKSEDRVVLRLDLSNMSLLFFFR
jgi:hypothetical protein